MNRMVIIKDKNTHIIYFNKILIDDILKKCTQGNDSFKLSGDIENVQNGLNYVYQYRKKGCLDNEIVLYQSEINVPNNLGFTRKICFDLKNLIISIKHYHVEPESDNADNYYREFFLLNNS